MSRIESQEQLLTLAEEPFLSIEGEGIHIGKPMTFVRLAQCSLRCSWCDTQYSWGEGADWSLRDIVDRISELGCVNVSLTGGEPLLQADGLRMLLDRLDRCVTYLNTAGTVWNAPVFDRVDWINCDLKMPSSQMVSNAVVVRRLTETYPEKLQFKIIVTPTDLSHLPQMLTDITSDIPITIQPEFHSYGVAGTAELAEWVRLHLQDRTNIRVLPQLHRLLWPERDKGV